MFTIFGLALLGGMILNITPCMLPVISLKIMNFVKISQVKPLVRILHGLVYAGGIILSFLALAAIIILIQMTGGAIGFGMHLSSFWFCLSMLAICGTMGASSLFPNLFPTILKWSKVLLPKKPESSVASLKTRIPWFYRLTSYLQSKLLLLKEKMPYISSFFHGILTTLIGSACCGPFLGVAMGTALALSGVHVIVAFLGAGIGMAFPYVLLTVIPKALAWIPKSGKWTVWIKRLSGVGMLMTSGWFLFLIL